MKRKQYDNIISLGTNCEVSFRCANLYKDYSTFPFSWVQIYDLDKFLLALNDMNGMYKGAYHFDKDLIVFEKYNIGFHLRNKEGKTINDRNELESLDDAISELKSRMNHLIDKWNKAKEEKNAFIQYITVDNVEKINSHINLLDNELSKHFNDYDLFIVVKKGLYKKIQSKNNKAIICYVKKVPTREQVSNPKYSDRIKWLKILRKIKKGNTLRYLYSTYKVINLLLKPIVKRKVN